MSTSKIVTVYPIDSAITRAEIIRPGCPLTTWYQRQTDKPDILFNAILYDGRTPCGTVIENDKLVHNAGTGRGLGIRAGQPGLGTPWEGWADFFTGYNCYVQAGKYVSPTWRDTYVFEKSLSRIAVGKIGNQWCVLTGNGTLAAAWNGRSYDAAGSFTKGCIAAGITDVVGLDGGGSRALLWKGSWIHTSDRTPYNAIAIWLDKKQQTEPEEMNAMQVVCNAKTDTYSSAGSLEPRRYVDAGDTCMISCLAFDATGKIMAQISYPTSAGKRTAYVRDLDHFSQPK